MQRRDRATQAECGALALRVHRASQTMRSIKADACVQTGSHVLAALASTDAVQAAVAPWIISGPVRLRGADDPSDAFSPVKRLKTMGGLPQKPPGRKKTAPPIASAGNPFLIEGQCFPQNNCALNTQAEGQRLLAISAGNSTVTSMDGNVIFYHSPHSLPRSFPLRVPVQHQHSLSSNVILAPTPAAIRLPVPTINNAKKIPTDSICAVSSASKVPKVKSSSTLAKSPVFNPNLITPAAPSAFVRVDKSGSSNKRSSLDALLYSKLEARNDHDQEFPVPQMGSGEAAPSYSESTLTPSPRSQEGLEFDDRHGRSTPQGNDPMTIEKVPLRPNLKKNDAEAASQLGSESAEGKTGCWRHAVFSPLLPSSF